MATLRLFRASEPFRQIDTRILQGKPITIGRDPAADWPINDPTRDLSGRHCVIESRNGAVFAQDLSTNGLFIGPDKRPAPKDASCEIALGETLHLGHFMILVDGDEAEMEQGEREQLPGEPGPAHVRPGHAPGIATDAALLEAFCHGAGLEPSSFAGEDPAGVMVRLGAVYRQVVDDLCVLMRDRAVLKTRLQMDRTTIAARDNNPLKWAPPLRVAVDLLQEGDAGFLKGADAFRASFEDLRRHGACMVAGSRSAVQHVLDELDPETIEAIVKRQPLHFVTKSDAAWKDFKDRHAVTRADTASSSGRVEGAFRAGYETHLSALEGEGGG